jgi:hypothetical protein
MDAAADMAQRAPINPWYRSGGGRFRTGVDSYRFLV